MGGLLRGLEMVSRVRDLNWGIIIGSLVGETSILTRLALTLAKVSGKNLLAQEGAFGTLLLSREIVKPVLMFGKGGVLKFQKTQNTLHGLGIKGDEDLKSERTVIFLFLRWLQNSNHFNHASASVRVSKYRILKPSVSAKFRYPFTIFLIFSVLNMLITLCLSMYK